MVVLGILLGLSGVRFWWHAMAILVALAVVLPFIGTMSAASDPLFSASEITASSAALAILRQFMVLAVGFAIGFGLRWIARKLTAKP